MRILLTCLFAAAIAILPASAQVIGDVHPDDTPAAPTARGMDRELVIDRLFGRLHKEKNPEAAALIASAILQSWSQSDSPSATILLKQASAAITAKQYRIAIAILSVIIEQEPGFAEAWNKRATAYFLKGDLERSLADIDKVLALEPRHFGALAGLGLVYRRQGKNAMALNAFRRALAIHPHLPDVKRAISELVQKTEQDI